MGSKYTTQSASGYNSSPPADDGTQTASNLITWAAQKTKLADPVKNLVDGMNTALVTAFDYSPRQISSSDNTVATDHMKTVEIAPTVTTAVTVSLGDAATMTNNYRVYVKNSSAINQTVGRVTSGDTINGVAGNITIPPGGSIQFQTTSAATGYLTVSGLSTGADNTNLLINPNWQIDQINEGALYTVNTTDVRGPDGWSGSAVGAGVFKLRTLADPDNAALKCLEITCTTADASIAATDDYFIYTAIEGYDAAPLMSGTTSALSVTVQFKFKTSVTGVYGVSLANSAKNRSNYQIITVADTSEHEYILSFNLDTTGTWLYTNGVGLYLAICLSAGSNFQGTAGAWAADAKQTTSAQCNFMSSTSNIAYLKRIQLVAGSVAQAYKPADIQKELAKAQRYYEKTFSQGVAVAQNAGVNGAIVFSTQSSTIANVPTIFWPFKATKRAVATLTTYNYAAANSSARSVNAGTESAVTNISNGDSYVGWTLNANGTTVDSWAVHATASARLS